MKQITFGEYLAKVIRYQNLTQKEAAGLLHISPQTLSNYILNKRIPDMKTLAHILKVFHMDANQVFHTSSIHPISFLTPKEEALLEAYRQLDLDHQVYALTMLQLMPKSFYPGKEHKK